MLRRMGEEREPRRVYSPGEVAERMGVSGQRLRQLAAAYERVRGELPRNDQGRLWPEPAVEDLEGAREAVRDGRAAGLEAALRGEVAPEGDETSTPAVSPVAGDIAGVAELVGELRALREAVEDQNRKVEELVEENRALRLRLEIEPAPVEPPAVVDEDRGAQEVPTSTPYDRSESQLKPPTLLEWLWREAGRARGFFARRRG